MQNENVFRSTVSLEQRVLIGFFALGFAAFGCQGPEQVKDLEGSALLPTGHWIQPEGRTAEFAGRPVDMVRSPDGKWLFVKDNSGLQVFAADTLDASQSIPSPGGTSQYGLAVTRDGSTVYLSNAESRVHRYVRTPEGKFKLEGGYTLPAPEIGGHAYPTGLALDEDRNALYVCASRSNALLCIDLTSGEVRKSIATGVAPYAVLIHPKTRQLWVTNYGGPRPQRSEKRAPSAGTDVAVDERGVAKSGSVSVISSDLEKVEAEISVGLHPCALAYHPAGDLVLVVNANSDEVTVIECSRKAKVQEIDTHPVRDLPFGSMPNALCVDEEGKVWVALAGNNAVGCLEREPNGEFSLRGLVPAGWYPSSVLADEGRVYVANNKGVGSRTRNRPEEKGRNSHDHRGSIQAFSTPTPARFAELSRKVTTLAKSTSVLRAYERSIRSNVGPTPVPAKLGEPSVFEHVIYVIKENRTYDQVLGDLPEGDGDPSLCNFPEPLSPNHHALAKEFVLLDNYYCNGVLSADGHSWATESNVTPYLERMFGGFTRSYTFGDDPLTYSSSGFIWDAVLAAGLSFRNYGEFNYSEPPQGMGFKEVYQAHKSGQRVDFRLEIGVERVKRYSCRDYPGWNMNIPDVLRVDRFLEEFREFEKSGDFPNFVIVYLPQDHLSGTAEGMPTPRAHMADNDLALGRLVEAVSKSKFWPKTVLFINEDDPQNGYDHVDGHRSICFVVSPYSRNRGVVSEFYNQSSVVRTMLHILGLPPLNQQDAASNLMAACFAPKPDFSAYQARPAGWALDELNGALAQRSGNDLKWGRISTQIPMHRTGLKSEQDEDNLNRILWHATKGYATPYPEQFAGAHGRGLKGRGLLLDSNSDED